MRFLHRVPAGENFTVVRYPLWIGSTLSKNVIANFIDQLLLPHCHNAGGFQTYTSVKTKLF